MSRCILVGGFPLLPKRARHEIQRQLTTRLKTACQSIADKNDNDDNGKPVDGVEFSIQVSITPHQNVEETIKILFAKRVKVATVEALCNQLNAAPHEMIIQLHNLGHKNDDSPMTTSFTPHFSLGAGVIRDHAFSQMPYHWRRQIECDSVGVFSLTPQRAAGRTARLLACFFLRDDNDESLVAVDGMAGVGGNTLGFLKYDFQVVSLELNPRRAAMLEANIALWKKCHATKQAVIETQNQSLLDYLPSLTGPLEKHILFLDPPWGGAQYSKIIQENGGDIVVVRPEDDGQSQSGWNFSTVALQIVRTKVFRLVAMKLPTVYDVKLVVDPLVHDDALGYDRPHPFRFQFGKSCQLVVLVVNDGSDSKFSNGPQGLDRMISNIMNTWHNNMNLQNDDGCREHRPEFYDWEKRRWILLKKWKGSNAADSS
mmetsp:Transcript_18148/g.49536  ORF Transcript_18148/g.49536 Transcript_18148/m.49536 type:complete len:427 (-) Transcript_18148:1571-2851(-)